MKYETFQEKLDRFKSEPIGFLVKSKEIADELAKVFDREGMEGYVSKSMSWFMVRAWDSYGKEGKLYVSYNYPRGHYGLSYGLSNSTGKYLDELIDITLEELKSYNANTLDDKLALFKAGTHVLHTPTQEIYDKLMIELDKRGYVWTTGDNMTGRSFAAEAEGRTYLCIQYNGFSDGKVNSGYLKYRKESGLEILTLTPEDFSTPLVITITTDGYHRTTAESNGVTAESLCNPTDTFDISKGSHIALKRLLEKLDEDILDELGDLSGETEEFHVGDIVEVVECDYNFTNDIKGIQGVITKKYERAYNVRFPVEYNGDDTWAFYGSELKLVRKYNA